MPAEVALALRDAIGGAAAPASTPPQSQPPAAQRVLDIVRQAGKQGARKVDICGRLRLSANEVAAALRGLKMDGQVSNNGTPGPAGRWYST